MSIVFKLQDRQVVPLFQWLSSLQNFEFSPQDAFRVEKASPELQLTVRLENLDPVVHAEELDSFGRSAKPLDASTSTRWQPSQHDLRLDAFLKRIRIERSDVVPDARDFLVAGYGLGGEAFRQLFVAAPKNHAHVTRALFLRDDRRGAEKLPTFVFTLPYADRRTDWEIGRAAGRERVSHTV